MKGFEMKTGRIACVLVLVGLVVGVFAQTRPLKTDNRPDWAVTQIPVATVLAGGVLGTDFECLDLSPALARFCWTENGFKHCVESCSIVDADLEPGDPINALLGERSMASSCLSDPGTGILLTFEPKPENLQFSIRRDSETGDMFAICWSDHSSVGDPNSGTRFDVPGGGPDDTVTWGIGVGTGIAGCEFHAGLLDRILVF
jgi:hypothetical protein